MTNRYALPPLPEPLCNLPTYCQDAIRQYTRTVLDDHLSDQEAAIEADRKRRGVNSTHTLGEPVAYLWAENLVRLAQPHVAGCAASIQKEPADGFIPIFTAPQPAEPGGYAHTAPDDCETLHWRGQILSLNELAEISAEPVKSHLKVSYDDKVDCLYVVCDSNEPTDAEEDDKGILYRYAASDGRLIGITVMNFMGQHPK